jgi:hypothetical protein
MFLTIPDSADGLQGPSLNLPSSVAVIFLWGGGCEAIGTAATPGLLCQPRVIVKMIVEK